MELKTKNKKITFCKNAEVAVCRHLICGCNMFELVKILFDMKGLFFAKFLEVNDVRLKITKLSPIVKQLLIPPFISLF